LVAGGNGTGNGLNQTSSPRGVSKQADGALYVLTDNSRLTRFDLEDTFMQDTLIADERGVYHFDMTTIQGCSNASSSHTIYAPEAILVSSLGNTVCEGDTTQLSVGFDSTYAYQWYKDDLTISGATTNMLLASEPGNYHVEVMDSNSCVVTSSPFRIWGLPQADLTASGLCLDADLITNTPDSNVVRIDWYRDNQLVKQVNGSFFEMGEIFVDATTDIGLDQPFDLATDHLGNIYYSEHNNHRVIRRSSDGGQATVVAGNGTSGTGLNQLNQPTGIFVDKDLNVYVADMANHRVVKWSQGATQGVVVAGLSGTAGSALSRLNNPWDVVVDDSGAVYVSDMNNHRVVKWLPNATSGTLFAGTGQSGSSINQLNQPHGLAIHQGAIYVSDHWNGRIVMVNNQGVSSAVASRMPGGDQRLSGVYVDNQGAIYFSELFNNRVVRWLPGASSGEIVAGGNNLGAAANQLGEEIYGITIDQDGSLYVADGVWNQRIMKYPREVLNIDTLTVTALGTYHFDFVTLQGCTSSSLSIQTNMLFSQDTIRVFGQDTSISVLNASQYNTFLWSTGGQDSVISISSTGNYSVVCYDSINSCLLEQSVFVYFGRANITFDSDTICEGEQVSLSVFSNNLIHQFVNQSIIWSTGDTLPSILVDVVSDTIISFELIDDIFVFRDTVTIYSLHVPDVDRKSVV
jgi:sugar lactone lactonase YvrE